MPQPAGNAPAQASAMGAAAPAAGHLPIPSCRAVPRPAPLPRLILTRPEAQNAAWAAQFAALGIDCIALPLIHIQFPDDAASAQRRQAALDKLGQWTAIMHVSPNAVQGFWDAQAMQRWHQLGTDTGTDARANNLPRLWAPGPGTAQALQAQGFAPEWIDQPAADAGQFDSEALWQQVQTQIHPGAQVLILRGSRVAAGPATQATPPQPQDEGHGRDWLARQLQQRGAQLHLLPVYRRGPPAWDAQQRDMALGAAAARRVWLLSSSEGVQHLPLLLPGQDATFWRGQSAIATHPRIAQAAQRIGFGQIRTTAPTVQDIALCLQGFGAC
ncbi:uroporphyrinogen III synthase [Vandammella animalimorsus]|uniref:Uroporphyrinogen-III synthase n=1 Tax=Vandammella animalimorsus TaxID=2029117 RepID=A0A2A2AKR6_9BURK|nr:uroporphyrinogen III synthase [Vandammella animalimorsus]